MAGYAALVMVLNMVVQCLLLVGTSRMHKLSVRWLAILLGGTIGGLYSGMCLLSRFSFLSASFWHFLILGIVGTVGFGVSVNGLRQVAVFILLNMALEGIVAGFGADNLWYCVAAVAVLGILCVLGFRGGRGDGACVPVEISYAGKQIRVTALHDTGNMLTDPITGQQVLVVDPSVAYRITGLTRQQLRTPLDAITSAKLPGLRLVPYRTVGQGSSFLLALRMQVKLGNKSGAYLVAFAPEMFGQGNSYQALAGGIA